MSTKPHIATFDVTTKKDTTQTTRWIVTQSHPHPSFNATYGIRLQDDEGLLKGHKLAKHYRCFLLRSDKDFMVEALTGTRKDHAGYSDGLVYDEKGNYVMRRENPGSIIYRGSSLGEVYVEFGNNPDYPSISVRNCYGNTAAGSERKFIMENVVPKLREFIEANSASLHAEAVAKLAARVDEMIAKARKELKECEDQLRAAIAKL